MKVNESEKPLVSIMVTAYNSEEYIEDCIRSLLAQSYRKLEILVVDDGSTDRTGEISDQMAKKDERIRVIHQKNGGVSHARNTAIREAKGDYLAFVDSDDYVAVDYVKVMLQLAQQYAADVVCCDFRKTHERYSEGGKRWAEKPSVSPQRNLRQEPSAISEEDNGGRPLEILDGKTVRNQIYTTQRMYYMICWNKLYRRGMFDGLSFPKGLLHEDEDVLAELFGRARTVVTTQRVLYSYYMSPDSIMRGPYQVERMGILLTYRKRMRMFAAEGNPEMVESSRRQCMVAALMQYYLCRRDPTIDRRYPALCLKCFRESLPLYLRSRTASKSYQLFFRIANHFPYLAGWLVELKSNRFAW